MPCPRSSPGGEGVQTPPEEKGHPIQHPAAIILSSGGGFVGEWVLAEGVRTCVCWDMAK